MRTRAGARPVWLFDLDGTLHDVRAAIMPRINADMTRFVMDRLSKPGAPYPAHLRRVLGRVLCRAGPVSKTKFAT